MLILLTNDDGVASEGLLILREYLMRDHRVYTVAPERERTCVGHAVTLHKPLRIKDMGEQVYSTNGTPVDCVILGVHTLLPERPDIVISGINKGPNMGQDIHYSGTIAAAKEGAFLGIPSMAASVCARKDFLFHDASRIVGKIIDIIFAHSLHKGGFLNINIPNVPLQKIRGFRIAKPGTRIYTDIVTERVDPRGGYYYWIGGNGDLYRLARGTDFSAVEKGYVSVTPLDTLAARSSSMHYYQTIFKKDL